MSPGVFILHLVLECRLRRRNTWVWFKITVGRQAPGEEGADRSQVGCLLQVQMGEVLKVLSILQGYKVFPPSVFSFLHLTKRSRRWFYRFCNVTKSSHRRFFPFRSLQNVPADGNIDFVMLQRLPTVGFFLSAAYKTFPPPVISIL